MSAGRLSRAAENRESGVNPERYRHCERGDRTRDESQSLGQPEKTVYGTVMRESGDLLKRRIGVRSRSWSRCQCSVEKRPRKEILPRLFLFADSR